jgi:hypothetical protein
MHDNQNRFCNRHRGRVSKLDILWWNRLGIAFVKWDCAANLWRRHPRGIAYCKHQGRIVCGRGAHEAAQIEENYVVGSDSTVGSSAAASPKAAQQGIQRVVT